MCKHPFDSVIYQMIAILIIVQKSHDNKFYHAKYNSIFLFLYSICYMYGKLLYPKTVNDYERWYFGSMNYKKSLKWMNFLYSFFGVEVVFKGFSNIGTLTSLLSGSGFAPGESLLSYWNFIALCSTVLALVEVVIKLIACITHKKTVGYVWMMRALLFGVLSNLFYVAFDKGYPDGIVLMILIAAFYGMNYLYVQKHKWAYEADYQL